MIFRFTLIHRDSNTQLRISPPDGWKQAVLKLARDKEFYSLIEFFDGSFIFYGDNGVVNGGIHFIENLEATYGPDVEIELLIEIAPDNFTYEEVFNGQLDLSLGERLKDNKYRIPIIRDNFWAKFNSRWQTPVDLLSETDLDEEPITDPVQNITLTMPSQIITYLSDYHQNYSITYDGADTYQMLNFDEVISDDIKLFSIVRDVVDFDTYSLLGLFEAPYDGEFRIQLKFPSAIYFSATPEWITGSGVTRIRIKKTNETGVDSYGFPDHASVETDGTDSWLMWDLDVTYRLVRGEQLAIALQGSLATVFGETELFWKTDVDLATIGATITLSGEQTIDGTMTSTSRVLVKDQGNTFENGIYDTGAGAWTRVTDLDTGSEFLNAAVFVTGGTANTATSWRQTEEVGAVGVDPVLWTFTDNSDERFRVFPGYPVENYIKITASTKFRTSVNEGFLIHDAAAAILKSYGLGEDNPFYSDLLGSQLTNARVYEADGCAWKYSVLKGLQIRGYELSEKPFFMSFEEWWKGINPILCLGLTYDLLESTEPDIATVQALADWGNAGGPFPGVSWDYASFPGTPFVSVNGGGGTEGYTCGLVSTLAGQTYQFSVAMGIEQTGSETADITFTWALLDASFNELATEQFSYLGAGFYDETFNMVPSADGMYIAVRVENNTPTQTKNVTLYMALGGNGSQLLQNSSFDDSSIWTQTGGGPAWTLGGGTADVAIIGADSQTLTQGFTDTVAGDYVFHLQRISTNFSVGVDSATLGTTFYDENDVLIGAGSVSEFIGGNNNAYYSVPFTALVPVRKIEIKLVWGSGANMDVSILHAVLFGPTVTGIPTPEQRIIRVEQRDFFYVDEILVNISNIENITRKYDNDVIFNKVEIGYTQWQAEDISGIDDPQTKKVYSTRFKKIGKAVPIQSEFIAASLAIETTRRQTVEKSKDYKFDNNVFIIAINPDDISPDAYVPELDENFTTILNLLNSDTRYNIRLSVARNFLRWQKWLNGCLQNYLTSFFKFVSGEGNYDMVTAMADESPDCLNEDFDGAELSEKQNIQVTDDIIHTPNYYEMTVPMEWETFKTIRNNRRNAIGISQTDQNHKSLFVDILDYRVMEGEADISGWTKEYMPIVVVEGPAAMQDCFPSTECDNPITDELGEILTDENGVCITE
jgi:hypothetical protein